MEYQNHRGGDHSSCLFLLFCFCFAVSMEVTVICCNQFNLPLSRISRQVIILTPLGEGDVIFTLQSSFFLPDSASFTGEIDIEVMFQ